MHMVDCLRLRREQLNLDIAVVAARINVSLATLEDYEDGSKRVPGKAFMRLMEILDISPTKLFASFVPG